MSKPQKDDFDAVRAVIEALTGFEADDQERILRWAREKLGLKTQSPSHIPATTIPAAPSMTGAAPPAPAASGADNASDIKTFVQAKAPASDVQFVAVVAYFYRFQAPLQIRKDAITAEDVLEACRLTGRQRPSKISQTMVNAHNHGLLDRAEGRGTYSINTVGENLVALTLPAGSSNGAAGGQSRRAAGKKAARGNRATKKAARPTRTAKKSKKR